MFTDRTLFPHQITFLDLILVALAAKAIIDFWKESSLVAGPRAYFEARGGLLGELMECQFCLSYHVCFWMSVLGRFLAAVLPAWLGLLILIVMFSLAAAGLTHLLFDLNELILGRNDTGPTADELPPTIEVEGKTYEKIEEAPATIKLHGEDDGDHAD